MFQIKTDIRQYNCETREKVEKLIRNWVIRPSDLIYNDDAGEWNPIGQHPSFDGLFRELEEEESRVPDTVVTSERPSGDDEDGGDVTQITESPLDDEDDEDDDPPQPPEPSEDVEGVIRDSDEITMMTDKTLDMMRLEDEEGGADEADEADDEETNVVERDEVEAEKEDTDVVERDEVADEDEDTDVVEREDVDGSPEEPTQIIDQDEVESAPEEESTNVIDRDEVEGDEEEREPSIVIDEDAASDDEASEGGGRHGLPEDVFVTNEIPSQSAEDSVLDELGELDEDDEDFDLDEGLDESDDSEPEAEPADDAEDGGEDEERRAKWRIVMSEDEDDVDEEWANVAEEIRDTDEFTQEDIESTISEDRDEPQESLDFDDDDEAEDEVEEELDDAADTSDDEPAEDLDEESELEEVEVEAVEDDDDDLDGLLDDAAELVGVNARDKKAAAAGQGREPVETPVGQTTDPAFVSEGYNMDLPIDVGPSKEDLAQGIPRATASEDTKATTFPYPKPKHPGRVIVRTFGLGEEIADDDDMADDLPEVGDPDVDPMAATQPVEDTEETKPLETRSPSTPNPKPKSSPSRSTVDEPPKDQSALIVILLLGTFIIALILAVYFLG